MSERTPKAWRSVRRLCLVASIAAILLALVYQATAPRIAEQQQIRERQALASITGLAAKEISMRQREISGEPFGYSGMVTAQLVDNRDGDLSAIVVPLLTEKGYNGDIHLLLAIDKDGAILGVAVTEHKETPGLADGIERQRSDWIQQFDGITPEQLSESAWTVQRYGGEFDQLTGATISSRAITERVGQALHSSALRQLRQEVMNE